MNWRRKSSETLTTFVFLVRTDFPEYKLAKRLHAEGCKVVLLTGDVRPNDWKGLLFEKSCFKDSQHFLDMLRGTTNKKVCVVSPTEFWQDDFVDWLHDGGFSQVTLLEKADEARQREEEFDFFVVDDSEGGLNYAHELNKRGKKLLVVNLAKLNLVYSSTFTTVYDPYTEYAESMLPNLVWQMLA